MSLKFTLVPSIGRRNLPHSLVPAGLAFAEEVFRTVVIDGAAGLPTNMDIAAEVGRVTSTISLALTHWSGVIHPLAAAKQIAALDRLVGGRLSLRLLPGPDGRVADNSEHLDALRQTDEYLILLKRLWSNDQAFDHEGPYYSLHDGYVEYKGPQGADMPIRIGGASGVAIDVAGRHATVFELPSGTPDEIRDLMRRVEMAAVRYGRPGRITFALPVLFSGRTDPHAGGRTITVQIPALNAGAVQTLLAYASLGIDEFMISGLDDHNSIASFARNVASLFERTVPIRAASSDSRSRPAVRLLT